MAYSIREILSELFSDNDELRYQTDNDLVPIVAVKLNMVPNNRQKITLTELIHNARVGL